MEDFNSKYTGQQVEDLLDQVANGEIGGGITVESDPIFSASPAATITNEDKASWSGKQDAISDLDAIRSGAEKGATALQSVPSEYVKQGQLDEISSAVGGLNENIGLLYQNKQNNITDLETIREGAAKGATAVQPSDIPEEIYLADFTMTSLRQGMNNGRQVDCDMNSLIEAMTANKTILVREEEDGYKGVYVLNGYAEDLLYFSIVDTAGDVLYCEGTDYTNSNYIDGQTLHVRRWDDKQDILVSGENIKTINGESIVGSGNISVATISDVNTAIANAITNAINASY